jgi:L-ribulose-5-phosphate 3-epimerase
MEENSIQIGIMNGRLSPQINKQIQIFPTDFWKDEFQKAKKCGFDSIEWIFDLNPNPILQNNGLEEMKHLSKKYDVKINSLCADYFMVKKLVNVKKPDLEQNLTVLRKLIQQCSKLEIEILEIPFVDASSLKTKTNAEQLVMNLQHSIDFANSHNVKITLETDLKPNDFKDLLKEFGTSVGANYDTGNSTALGYDPKEELEILKPWLTNIHIKDRIFKGNTVSLGKGDTDFELIFSILSRINYRGQLIIQGAREDQIVEPIKTCEKYLKYVKNYVDKYNLIAVKGKLNNI